MNNTSYIVSSQDLHAIQQGKVQREVVKKMLSRAITTFTNKPDTGSAWKELFSPKDVVGIKLNCLGGKGIAPRFETVDLIARALIEAGVPERNVIVWDRFDRDLVKAGFSINRSGKGYAVVGTDRQYDPAPTLMGSIGSCFSQILSRRCTAIINVGVLKDHDLAGLSVAMKNWYGVIHNPHKYHENNCNPYLADLCASRMIRSKHRLTVIDALYAQYQGGPAFVSQYRWNLGTILLGTDEVAIDTLAARIIDEKRKEKGLKTLRESGRYPPWLKSAHERGLGEDNFENIEVVRV